MRNGDAPEITIDRTSYSWYIYGTSSEQNETSILGDMNWGGGYGEEGLTSGVVLRDEKDERYDRTERVRLY